MLGRGISACVESAVMDDHDLADTARCAPGCPPVIMEHDAKVSLLSILENVSVRTEAMHRCHVLPFIGRLNNNMYSMLY